MQYIFDISISITSSCHHITSDHLLCTPSLVSLILMSDGLLFCPQDPFLSCSHSHPIPFTLHIFPTLSGCVLVIVKVSQQRLCTDPWKTPAGPAAFTHLPVLLRSFFRPTTRRYVGLPSFFSPPSSHRALVLLRSNLADAIPSCCLLSCTILVWCCDTISRVRYISTSHSYDY